MSDQNSFCEEHQCFFELFEADDFNTGDYYECPECARERSEALYDGPHYDCLNKEPEMVEEVDPYICPECFYPHSSRGSYLVDMEVISSSMPLKWEERICPECHNTWIIDYEKKG